MKIGKTNRGFASGEFEDKYGSKCSIQESSIATEACIWLGVDEHFNSKVNARMHLTTEMVEELIPVLQHFVKTGYLPKV